MPENKIKMPVADLSLGVFSLRLSDGESVMLKRFIKL